MGCWDQNSTVKSHLLTHVRMCEGMYEQVSKGCTTNATSIRTKCREKCGRGGQGRTLRTLTQGFLLHSHEMPREMWQGGWAGPHLEHADPGIPAAFPRNV